MNSNDRGLLDFNIKHALSGFISAEEHAIGTDIGIDSWCIQKHLKYSVSGHHLTEMIQLTSEDNPLLSKKLADLKKRVEIVSDNPSPSKIRDLRNEFRELVNEKTYNAKCGTICALDRRKSHKSTNNLPISTNLGDNELMQHIKQDHPSEWQKMVSYQKNKKEQMIMEEGESSDKTWLFIGGAVVLATILVVVSKKA